MKNVMEDGNKEALEEIAKVKANKAEILDLIGLGLTAVPPEVFEVGFLLEADTNELIVLAVKNNVNCKINKGTIK